MSIKLESESAKWLEGIVDCHVYLGPDVYALRQFDVVDFARQARSAGYAGMIVKAHTYNNAPLCTLAKKIVPGIEIYGGIVLNWTVGGLNPEAVEACLLMGGKEIWLGNMHVGQLKNRGIIEKTSYSRGLMPLSYRDKAFSRPLPAINIIDEDGKLLPEVLTILDLIAEHDAILGTCHISKEECFIVVPEARRRGVKRIVITHANVHPSIKLGGYPFWWKPAEQKKIVELGAKLELFPPTPDTAKYFADAIRNVGPENCVVGSNAGSLYSVHPIEAMRLFMCRMLSAGIDLEDILKICVDNGQWLIGLR